MGNPSCCTMLIGLLLAVAVNAQQQDLEVEVDVLGSHVPRNLPQYGYFGRTTSLPQPQANQLLFQGQPDLISGDRLVLTDTTQPSRRMRSLLQQQGIEDGNALQVNGYQLKERPSKPKDFDPQTGVIALKTAVFLINIDGFPPLSRNGAYYKSQWFNSFYPGSADNNVTMENYYAKCSYGKTLLTPVGNDVFDFTATPMPATGGTAYSRGIDYITKVYGPLQYDTTKQCGFIELYAMQEWAQLQLSILTGSNSTISQYPRRIVITPAMNMDSYGKGSQGCVGAFCYIWIRGDRIDFLNTVFHELGHTLYEQHSSTDTWEYGDCSCVMGCSSDRACFNAPASVRAGWSKPIASHFAVNTTAGLWYNYAIPAMEISDTNNVRIFPNWTTPLWSGSALPAYYLSMKLATGFDTTIAAQYTSTLSIHTSSAMSIYDSFRPNLLGGAGIQAGGKMNDTVTQLVVRFNSANATHAMVSFCRYTAVSETGAACFNGLDDDCDGLIDGADPTCSGGPVCGDHICSGLESARTCPSDCPMRCGDGYCDPRGESYCNCQSDCAPVCGDGCCSGGETLASCYRDCAGSGFCGDGFCDQATESTSTCRLDCPGFCGDGICNTDFGESCATCQQDCPRGCLVSSPVLSASPPPSPPPPPPPPLSPPPPPPLSPPPPPPPSSPPPPVVISTSPPPSPPPPRSPPPPPPRPPPPVLVTSRPPSPPPPAVTPTPTPSINLGICGDGFCDRSTESVTRCPRDCPAVCGDGYCDYTRGETASTCPLDCPGYCGDGICTPVEAPWCKRDCPYCGDGKCAPNLGESCSTCPRDCGSCFGRRALKDDTSPLQMPEIVPDRRTLLDIAMKNTIVSPDGVHAPASFQVQHQQRTLLADFQLAGNHPADIVITERERGPSMAVPNLVSKRRLLEINGQAQSIKAEAPAYIVCGDGICSDDEDVATCAMDCCPSGKCGDGFCQAWLGESCETCPDDCPGDLDGEDKFCCGAFIGCADERCSAGGSVCQVSCTNPTGIALKP